VVGTRLGIAVEEGRVSAAALRLGRLVWAAEATYADVTDLAHVLASLAAERPRGHRRARVALGPGLARVKEVDGLPKLRRADLVAHVRLTSRRYFLQNGVALVTDALPLRARPGGGGRALLAAAPLPLVEAVTTGLEAAGLACDAIIPSQTLARIAAASEGDERFGDARTVAMARRWQLVLAPDGARAERARRDRRALGVWALLATASMVLAGASWFGASLRQERTTVREIARLRPAFEVALDVRRDLDATTEALGVLAAAERTRHFRARVLASLADALPDSAFLVNLRLNADGTGSMAGYAPRAAVLVTRLGRSQRFQDLALDGPVTREAVAGREWERFAVRFREARTEGSPR